MKRAYCFADGLCLRCSFLAASVNAFALATSSRASWHASSVRELFFVASLIE
jgi:hypothetical protein